MNSTPTSQENMSLSQRIQEALVTSERMWAPCEAQAKGEMSLDALRSEYEKIHAKAELISGQSEDAVKRAILYYSVYLASEGNFMFPLIATHGSLWGVSHTLRIERGLQVLRPVGLGGRVQRWLECIDSIRDINRRVFVEIYSTFYFTRFFGRVPGVDAIIKPDILALYNRVHVAIETKKPLTLEGRREVYFDIFVHEQHDIVDPGLQDATKAAQNPVLVKLFSLVRPRFKYFPKGERLFFTDFTCVDQRNREGLRALAFAEQVGPERVLEAILEYPIY